MGRRRRTGWRCRRRREWSIWCWKTQCSCLSRKFFLFFIEIYPWTMMVHLDDATLADTMHIIERWRRSYLQWWALGGLKVWHLVHFRMRSPASFWSTGTALEGTAPGSVNMPNGCRRTEWLDCWTYSAYVKWMHWWSWTTQRSCDTCSSGIHSTSYRWFESISTEDMVKTEMLNKESDSEGLTGIHTIMA